MPIKKILKSFVPPIVIQSYFFLKTKIAKEEEFTSWWGKTRLDKRWPADLVAMMDYYQTTQAFQETSSYWHSLNRKNLEQLRDAGYENFRQTVARNYFTWVGWKRLNLFKNLLVDASDSETKISLKELVRKQSALGEEESISHNVFTFLIFDYLKKKGLEQNLTKLDNRGEAAAGTPTIILDNLSVSQDDLNSLLEYAAIKEGLGSRPVKKIVEIGAGHGRTTYCLNKMWSGLKYVVVDIPPALFLSQTFLSQKFPDKKIFKFRPFDSWEEIKEEYEQADLVFLMPDQLPLVKDAFDLFLAIDCLHEMKLSQINFYFDQANRIARDFYFKCWQETKIEGVIYREDIYPVKNSWTKVFSQPCHFPAYYFESFYRLKD